MKHPMSFGEFRKEAAGAFDDPELFRIWLLYCATYLRYFSRTRVKEEAIDRFLPLLPQSATPREPGEPDDERTKEQKQQQKEWDDERARRNEKENDDYAKKVL